MVPVLQMFGLSQCDSAQSNLSLFRWVLEKVAGRTALTVRLTILDERDYRFLLWLQVIPYCTILGKMGYLRP